MADAAVTPLLPPDAAPPPPERTVRPKRRANVVEVKGREGRVLYSSGTGARLNDTGGAIWDLCDGQRSMLQIADALRSSYQVDDVELLVDVTTALAKLQRLGLLETAAPDHPPVKLVVGIEDTTFFHWQLPILFESLIGQLPDGWEILVVVCNDHAALTEDLQHVLRCYEIRHLTGANHPANENVDFGAGPDRYVPLNRIEALRIVAEHVDDDDVVCLLDTDNFLYREIDLAAFPAGNAVCANWLIRQELFFAEACGRKEGLVDLPRFLASFGCTETFKPGGVTVFVTGETLHQPKFVQDCFRFTQVLYLLGKIGGIPTSWVAEMPCFALSMTANALAYDIVDDDNQHFVITKHPSINPGAFYHYYSDFADGHVDGAFYHSTWCKQQFRGVNFLRTDIDVHAADAACDYARFFFQLAKRAQRRLALAA